MQCVVLFIPVTSEERKLKYEITLVGSTPVKELINNVAKHMKFEPNSFQLRLQSLHAPDKVLFKLMTKATLIFLINFGIIRICSAIIGFQK